MKHFLADAETLNNVSLAQATEQDIADYTTEFTENLIPAYESDRQLLCNLESTVRNAVSVMFGAHEKESRYFERSIRKNRQKNFGRVPSHYEGFPCPSRVEALTACAKEKMLLNKKHSKGLDRETMNDVDEAIKFLINKGYSYETDFSAHNAVDIAMALVPLELDEDSSLLKLKCPCGEYFFEMQGEKVGCFCKCSMVNTTKSISFQNGQVDLKEINVQ